MNKYSNYTENKQSIHDLPGQLATNLIFLQYLAVLMFKSIDSPLINA